MSLNRRKALQVIGTTFAIGGGSALSSTTGRGKTTDSITIEQNNGDADLRGEDEHCAMSEGLLADLNAQVGDQIRVGPDELNPEYESGLYTVTETRDESRQIEMSKSGLERLDMKNNVDGVTRSYAPHPDHDTRAEADANDEYVEILTDDGEQSALVACAPHGGWIEYRTDTQAEYVASTLGVTEWSCAGYNSGGGSYDRWHITSTDITPRAFPKLSRVSDRGFTHAVSFHGFSDDGIAIGGGASDSLKAALRDEIDDATDGAYDVYLLADDAYDGDSSDNFVNWLTQDDNGIQIEQGWDARTDDWETIARAVSRFYAERI